MLARRLSSLPDMAILGTTGDGGDWLRQIKELQPDLVLVDIKLRNADGMEVCRKACATSGSTPMQSGRCSRPTLTPKNAGWPSRRGYADTFFVDTLRLAQRIRQLACPEGRKSKGHI
jgi:hypothetical protein